MLLIVSGLLIVVSALALSDLYRLSTWNARIVAFYIFCWAHIVVVAQTVGALNVLRPAPYFVMQIVICVVCVGVWYWVKRNELSLYAIYGQTIRTNWNIMRRQLPRIVRRYPALTLFTAAMGVAALLWMIQFLGTAPNTDDARYYHLPRVGYWMQHENLLPWNTLNERQTTFPMVYSLGILWIALAEGGDRLSGFLQWTGTLMVVPAMYGISRCLGAARTPAWFVGMIWLSLPCVALLSSAIFNDLLVAAFITSAVYLLFLGIKTSSAGALVISGMCIGLAFGTKSTALFIAPGLALGALCIWLYAPRRRFKLLAQWTIACSGGVLILGSFSYITNTAYYHNPLGASQLVEFHTTSLRGDASRLTMLQHNILRYTYLFIDPEGLPEAIARPIHEFRTALIGAVADRAELNLNAERTRHVWQSWEFGVTRIPFGSEARTWYGILSVILIVPAAMIAVVIGVFRSDPLRIMLIIVPFVFVLLQFTLEPFSINISRYFAPLIGMTLPLVAVALPSSWLRGWRPIVVVAVAVYLGFHATVSNRLRPFTGDTPFWEQSLIEQQSGSNRIAYEHIKGLNVCVPHDAALGLLVNFYQSNYEYDYFLPGFTRTLIQFNPIPGSRMTQPSFDQYRHIAFLWVRTDALDYIPADFVLWRKMHQYSLYVRSTMTDQAQCAPQNSPLSTDLLRMG
jgi:4-amino-4-deoxy-L-arabinose transferase-like glycosyltransferase